LQWHFLKEHGGSIEVCEPHARAYESRSLLSSFKQKEEKKRKVFPTDAKSNTLNTVPKKRFELKMETAPFEKTN